MADHGEAIRALAHNHVRLQPSQRVKQAASIGDYDAWYASWAEDPERFWDSAARELHWFEPWRRVCEISIPHHTWFVGAKTNLSYNCLERNIERGLGDKPALLCESETGARNSYSYRDVLVEVSRIANALDSLGVSRGDRVVIYMPLSARGIFTMQACARIGAIHSVVYAGMGAEALRHRIEDCGARVVVCADVTYRRGKTVDLRQIFESAVSGLDQVEHILCWRRSDEVAADPRELDFSTVVDRQGTMREAEPMDADDTAFILYTSGTTGKPKGVVHVHGGFAVGVHTLMRHYFDTSQDDVWWSTSDIGWIVGHAYICYGPLMVGATQVIREGAPDYPHPGVVWELVERYAVTTMFTAPTAVRMFMRMGEDVLDGYDRSSLRVFYCAGEPFNPEAWVWAQQHICADGGHVVDNYWQTEIASPMLGTFASMEARPGFVGKPMPGISLKVVDESGTPRGSGEGGLLVMQQPVPYMMKTIYGDPQRYASYWSERLGGYVTGDIAMVDPEGYWAVLGRCDDVLNVAGHRIGTADVEGALISHDAVVESAVIGLPDEIKGEIIAAFVVTKDGERGSSLRDELIAHVRAALGPIAQPSRVVFLDALPKTRSGKIMRRLLRARELGEDEGDLSTLED